MLNDAIAMEKFSGWVLRKLNMGLPCDPAIPLLDIYPQELKAETQTDTYASIFMAASFIIAKRKKQPNYPSWVHQQMNGKAKCSICIQWNIIQP